MAIGAPDHVAAGRAPAAITPPLVERDRELAAIGGVLDSAEAGSGAVLVVDGEPGTGKTRLLGEAAALADAREMSCLLARGAELERRFAFGAIRRLLERELADVDPAKEDELFSGAGAPAASLLRGTPELAPPQDALFAAAHGFFWVIARLCGRRPTLLAVDDLHWVDEPSRRMLAYVAERADELSISLVLALRSGEELGPTDPRRMLGDSPVALGLRTKALSEQGTARVLGGLLGSVDEPFSAAVHAATGGNPLLIRELALATATEGVTIDAGAAELVSGLAPETVSGWALQRLDRLPQSAGALARSLAVLERAPLGVAAEHAGLDAGGARMASDALAEAGLIDRTLPLCFAHPVVRAALYRAIPPGSRDHEHRRAAVLLKDRGAEPESVASHLLECEARGEDWAVEALRAAAAGAASRGAADEAVRILDRALAEPGQGDDPQLLLELAHAEIAVSHPAAPAHVERAAATATAPELRARVLGTLGHVRYLAGDFAGAFAVVREALAEIPAGGGGPVEAELLLSYLLAGRAVPTLLPEVERQLTEARPGPGGGPSPAEIVRRNICALDAYLRGRRRPAIEDARWVAARLRDPSSADALPSLLAIGPAFVLAGVGEYGEAEVAIDRALERARRRGSRLETAETLHDRVWLRWRRGEISSGLADAEAIVALTEGAWDVSKVPLRVAHADMLLERSDPASAAALLRLPEGLEERLPGTWGWPWLPWGRARIALARGHWSDALELALVAGRRVEEIRATSPEYVPWRPLAAEAALRLGDRDQARSLVREEVALASGIGSPRAIGIALATRARVESGADGLEWLREAVAQLDSSGAELERARAQLALGIALRRARHPRDARSPLREALDTARTCGSTALAEQALAELRAAGGRPRRERMSGSEALTPREMQIAELAAGGLGNVEIAERLFITRKTVESHMRTIFRKLGVSARGEVAAALRDGG